MAQRTAFSLLMAGVLVCGDLAAAQPAPQPTTPSAALAQSQSAAHVTLGQAAVPLYGPWKFQIGDSPIDPKTGQPLWAEPDFDDSMWEMVDLTPKDGVFDPLNGLPGYRICCRPGSAVWPLCFRSGSIGNQNRILLCQL
jgi:hypothetical protein